MAVASWVEMVVCAAPLADRAHELVGALTGAGWTVSLTTSTNGAAWVDRLALDAIIADRPQRSSGQPRPTPAAVIAAPATFNTLNKLRAGISDTAAMGVLNDAVGQRLPVLVVPMISERLVDHPAWPATVDWLHQAGVTILDPTTGRTDAVFPLASGEGPAVAERFDPAGLTDWLAGLS